MNIGTTTSTGAAGTWVAVDSKYMADPKYMAATSTNISGVAGTMWTNTTGQYQAVECPSLYEADKNRPKPGLQGIIDTEVSRLKGL